MSVKQQADGRRSLEVGFDVPGSPGEVWDAIATGPGLSAWFVPTRFETDGDTPTHMVTSFGPHESRAEVMNWDPPRSWSARGEAYGGAPAVTTEWQVDAMAGGRCRVRMVHSVAASIDEWDGHLEGVKGGWAGFLAILQLYLTHFRGLAGVTLQLSATVAMTEAQAWEALTTALGVKGTAVGQHWRTPADAPPLSGVLEAATEDPFDALIRLDAPTPGLAALGAYVYPGGPTTVAMNLYLYGDDAAASVARITPQWEEWFQRSFPTRT